jgi:hypothetical protein
VLANGGSCSCSEVVIIVHVERACPDADSDAGPPVRYPSLSHCARVPGHRCTPLPASVRVVACPCPARGSFRGFPLLPLLTQSAEAGCGRVQNSSHAATTVASRRSLPSQAACCDGCLCSRVSLPAVTLFVVAWVRPRATVQGLAVRREVLEGLPARGHGVLW